MNYFRPRTFDRYLRAEEEKRAIMICIMEEAGETLLVHLASERDIRRVRLTLGENGTLTGLRCARFQIHYDLRTHRPAASGRLAKNQ